MAGSPTLSVENRSDTDILLILKQNGTREIFTPIKREEKVKLDMTRGLYTSIMVLGLETHLKEHFRHGPINWNQFWTLAFEGIAGTILFASVVGTPLGLVLLSDFVRQLLGIEDNSPFDVALVDSSLASVNAEGEMVVAQRSYTWMWSNMSTVIRSSWKPVQAKQVHWVADKKRNRPEFEHCLQLDFRWPSQ